ncbi:hypothetical protein MHU86_12820 [Fragilaria crotonensis]|nr:hypothetical protein MHU86_12820 [Fragilaria crotonensis]
MPTPTHQTIPLPSVPTRHPQINNPPSQSHSHGHEDKNKESNSTTSSADGKMSALIPNSNIPINDGTLRISLRWKTTADVVSLAISQQSQKLSDTIHLLLNDIFRDEDGLLYLWKDEGTENHNVLSRMTPEEVRSYIAPSISVLPSKSQIIIALRFGFNDKPPFAWKNQSRVQEALTRNKVSVMFSNSKSTSGDQVISGYILLKAPRTTHRTRFLQSLRSKLPATTPFFDIFLHRRTPFDQDINHLVVQCGKNHVHSLSQTLLSALDGSGTGVYIPRFAFAKMTTAEAMHLFDKHDSYIKSLRYIQLSPLINNLDTMRTEFFPDGTQTERTTRDWAASIRSADGNESAHVDVVNGGYDQKSFLLMAPQHEVTVRQAFEEYRRRVFPFTIREERFRDAIGPPPSVIHVFSKVNENLSSIDKLFSSTESWKQSTSQGDESCAEAESRADSSLTPGGAADKPVSPTRIDASSDSGGSNISAEKNEMAKPTAPPTPLDSLREQYGMRSTAQTAASTDSNNSATSRLSSMSTSTARFQEIEARIQRQQKEFDRKDRINTERLERMERQFTRFDDMDHRFDTMEGNLMNVMETQAGVGGTMNKLSDKLSALMNMIAMTHIHTEHAPGISSLLQATNSNAIVAATDQQSFSSSHDPSNRQLDRESFSSPIKKKYRTGFTKDDDIMEDIGPNHDTDDNNGSADAGPQSTILATTIDETSDAPNRNSSYPFSQAVYTPLPPDDTTASQLATTDMDEITTDLESRYKDQNSQGGGSTS